MSQSLSSALAQLTARWQSEGIDLSPASDADSVRRLFARLGSPASPDAIALYSTVGGMADMDREYWRLWPLDEVEARNPAPSDFGIAFSDYLDNCYQFRIKSTASGTSEVWFDPFGSAPPVRIADSLEEFFGTYLSDPDRVLNAPARG